MKNMLSFRGKKAQPYQFRRNVFSTIVVDRAVLSQPAWEAALLGSHIAFTV